MGQTEGRITDRRRDAAGVLHLTIDSPYQPVPTAVRVLQPQRGKDDSPRRVVYVLPVDVGVGGQYGDGLIEIQQRDLHNRHGFVAISPAFEQMPWYIDHPTDATRRHESHLMGVVLPVVDAELGMDGPCRLILGFSKSGWGAVSLLLRYSDVFAAVALWDAPLMAEQILPGWQIDPLLASAEDFATHALPTRLKEHGQCLDAKPRMVLIGGGYHAEHMTGAHALMTDLRIPHHWLGPMNLKHHWGSGWVEPAVEQLMGLVT